MQNDDEIRLEPAPWNLTGNAYALIYKFPKEFVVENGFMEDFQKKRFLGYFGTVMLVDYQSSNVGKYYELLFIPGMFTFDWTKVFSISKIYVSSEESVLNGYNNWGIPKEKADFEWVEDKNGVKKVQVSINKYVIFEAELSKGFLSIPAKSDVFPLKLAQKLNNDLMLTSFNFKGKIKFLKIEKIKVDKGYFPDITRLSPLLTIQINNFDMRFEMPLIRKNYFE